MLDPTIHLLTNNMSSEIVLKLNIIALLLPILIDKHSFEAVSEKARVGGQVKLEMSEDRKRENGKHVIYIKPKISTWLLSF